MSHWLLPVVWILLLCTTPAAAQDGPMTQEHRLALVAQVEQKLTDKKVQVALLGRMGRPQAELPDGMHFTHVGFVVAQTMQQDKGQTAVAYTTHNLYQQKNDPDVSALLEDSLENFFATAAELEAGIIIPSPPLQQRLLALIGSPSYHALHDPHYSLIANPYTLGKQNCTEFVLDVLHVAIHQTADIQQIKAQERTHFVAQQVHVSPIKLRLAALFKAEIALSDQSDPPVTATFETIGDFLKQYDSGSEVITLVHNR